MKSEGNYYHIGDLWVFQILLTIPHQLWKSVSQCDQVIGAI